MLPLSATGVKYAGKKWIFANYISCIFQNFPWGYKSVVIVKGNFITRYTCILAQKPALVVNEDKYDGIVGYVDFNTNTMIPYNSVRAAVVSRQKMQSPFECTWTHRHTTEEHVAVQSFPATVLFIRSTIVIFLIIFLRL